MMGRWFVMLLLGWCVGVGPQSSHAAEAEAAAPEPSSASSQPMVITAEQVSGSVLARADGSAEWTALRVGDTVAVGTQVRTGLRGSLRLSVGPNATIEVQRLSELTIGQFEMDGQAKVLRTLIAIQHGKIDFDVKHVGFENDFRIASPTDVVAVKGTLGTCQSFGGPMDVTGHRRNGRDAMLNEHRSTGRVARLSGAEMIRGPDRQPMATRESMANAVHAMGGAADMQAKLGRPSDSSRAGQGMQTMGQTMQTMRGEVARPQTQRRWVRHVLEDPKRRAQVLPNLVPKLGVKP